MTFHLQIYDSQRYPLHIHLKRVEYGNCIFSLTITEKLQLKIYQISEMKN